MYKIGLNDDFVNLCFNCINETEINKFNIIFVETIKRICFNRWLLDVFYL